MKISFVIASAMLAAACLADDARFSAYVVDEVSGEPISGARVKSWFEMDIGWRAWSESPPIVTDEGVTDIKGSCRQRGKTNTGGITCHAEKPGEYYRGVFFKKLESKNFWGIWQPDNLVATIRLQRVEHPIPLFVRNVGDHINRSKAGRWNGTNMVLRYDFVKGDYLPPDGNGEVADIVVDSRVTYLESTNVYGEAKTFFDITNVFSFPGEGNGLIPIITKPTDGIKLRIAPVNGYENDFALKCGTRKQVSGPNLFRSRYSETDPNRCHYLRIRSEFDEDGNLVKAYYGKIYGDFKVRGSLADGCSVEFLYYINPTSLDRNLEWDMKNNLYRDSGSVGKEP
jgi:hypothetical protein